MLRCEMTDSDLPKLKCPTALWLIVPGNGMPHLVPNANGLSVGTQSTGALEPLPRHSAATCPQVLLGVVLSHLCHLESYVVALCAPRPFDRAPRSPSVVFADGTKICFRNGSGTPVCRRPEAQRRGFAPQYIGRELNPVTPRIGSEQRWAGRQFLTRGWGSHRCQLFLSSEGPSQS
jgi:hypothetical protein